MRSHSMSGLRSSASDRTERLVHHLAPTASPSIVSQTHVELCVGEWNEATEVAIALALTLLLRLGSLSPVIHVRLPDARLRKLPRLADSPLLDAIAREHAGFEGINRLTTSPIDDPAIRLVFGS